MINYSTIPPEPLEPEQQPARRKMAFTPISELTKHPKPHNWLIKGLIEVDSVGLIFGKPASGKSLIIMDWAFCIAAGIDWKGHKVKQGDVFYIAGEGFSGLGRRFKGLEVNYGQVVDNVFMSKMPTQLVEPAAIRELADVIKATSKNPVLIVFDTLHRNFGGGDENSSRDFGLLMNNVDMYLKPLGATVVFIHHSGHGTEARSRGSSSINGSLDVEYSVSKDAAGLVTLANTKPKEIQKPDDKTLEIEGIDTGWQDEDGKPVTTPVIVDTDRKPAKASKHLNQDEQKGILALQIVTENESMAIDAPLEIIKQYGGFSFTRKIARYSDWREELLKQLSGEFDFKEGEKTPAQITAKKRAKVKRVKDGLCNAHKIVFDSDYIWSYNAQKRD